MNKKEIAVSFLKMAGMGDVKSAYEKFIAPDFIHHNQYFKGDRQSLMQGMIDAHQTSPNKSIEIKYVYEEGLTVITHSLVSKKDISVAVVHIFRFENNKVVELWDLGQAIDPKSSNEYGLF